MLTIYDKYGRTRSLAWLRNEFGRVEIESPDRPEAPYYEIVELRESDDLPAGAPDDASTRAVEARASILVTVLDGAGRPVPGIPVAWWWPDAPEAREIGWGDHGVTGATGEEGTVGHPMGGGAYYDPRVAQGPHCVWIAGEGRSQMIAGLGMIAGTNHRHLDVTFRETTPQPQPPGPQPGPDLGHLLLTAQQAQAMAQGATATLDDLIGQLMTYRCAAPEGA
jgi:hypothetical protein